MSFRERTCPLSICVVILTKNEERHIARAIGSVSEFVERVVVVDSGSSDQTVALAKAAGAEVLENTWINYATQFNWALDQLPEGTQWVLRLDADEVVTQELAQEITQKLGGLTGKIDGVYVSRRMTFLGRTIRWGGVFPVRVLRLFRHTKGRCENRWMDEHIQVLGAVADFAGEIIDDNKNQLTWWIAKHNDYASREVVDLLNLEYGFMTFESVATLKGGQQTGVKRWIKENIYAKLPGGLRALLYFLYRYILRLGFLDGREGTAFHVLQGFWYRYLVDTKLHEVKTYMKTHDVGVVIAIRDVLNIDVS